MKPKTKSIISLFISSIISSFFGIFTALLFPYMGGFYQIAVVFLIVGIFLFPTFIFENSIKLKNFLNPIFIILIVSFPVYVIFFTMSINRISVGDAFFYNFSLTLISSTLIGKYFFKEKLSKNKLYSLISLLIGLAIYAYPFNLTDSGLGIALGVLAGISNSISNATRKLFSGKLNKWSIIFLQMITGSILSYCLALSTLDLWNFNWEILPTAIILLYFLGNLAVSYLLTQGFKRISMNLGSIILAFQLVLVPIWGAIFFKQMPRLNHIIGNLIILATIISSNQQKQNFA